MKYTIIIALIAMLSTGCTTCASKSFPFYCRVSNKFSEKHKNLIFDAMSIWNESLNTTAFVIDNDYDIYDYSKEPKFKNIITIQPKYDYNATRFGSTDRISCNIEINQGALENMFDDAISTSEMDIRRALYLRDIKFKTLMLHEFGHALGARHSKKESVMNKDNSNKYTDCIDEESIIQLCKRRDCSEIDAVATCN